MDAMKDIEFHALVNSGIPEDYVTNAVNRAVEDLLSSNVNNQLTYLGIENRRKKWTN